MKVYLPSVITPPANKFAGQIGSSTAVLDEDTLKQFPALRSQLIAFGKALAEQYKGRELRDSGRRVIGVDILGVDFSLIFQPKEDGR